MSLVFSSYTSKGGRSRNEDAILVARLGDGLLAVVADGLGMHGGGDAASRTAVQALSQTIGGGGQEPAALMARAFEQANSAVLALHTSAVKMKSTAVALAIRDGRWVTGHMGDSRCYWFSGGRMEGRTIDHSVSQMAVALGEITPEQIRFHEDRNKVLRCLGGDEHPRPDISAPKELGSQDAFLLCSDGFWELVLEAEMERDLSGCLTPAQWLARMRRRVEDRIGKEGDNHSAIAVFCKNKGGLNL